MPHVQENTVWVLLPIHNRRDTTLTFVERLLAQTHPCWRLILLDDGSDDGSADAVLKLVPQASVLRGDGTWWWAGALHHGYRWIKRHANNKDDVVLIINDDTEIEAEFLKNGVAALRPRSLLLAQQYTAADRRLVEVGATIDWRKFTHNTTLKQNFVNCQPTRGLFLRVKDFFEIGGFHPILLPHYQSDYEFTMRARRMGFELASDPTVRLFYDEAKTGVDNLESASLLQRLRIAFSKRYKHNPLYLTAFVLLACPAAYKLLNIMRVWKSFFREVVFCDAFAVESSNAIPQCIGHVVGSPLPSHDVLGKLK